MIRWRVVCALNVAMLMRCSDDGEPSGTAGRPMLDVLAGAGLCNIVVVVTRYFGGTLLGTGGLVRAYSGAVKAGLEENDKPAVQAGLEYAHNSGVFAGYWGSMLNYDPTDDTQSHGFEHDFYVGYGRELNEDWSYKSQITAYVYQGGGSVYNEDRSEKRRTTGVDFTHDVMYKDLRVGMSVLLSEILFVNCG